MKKFFALASVTAVAGIMMAGAAAGCSSTTTTTVTEDAATKPDAKTSSTTDSGTGGNVVDSGKTDEDAGPQEQGTVGKECKSTRECNPEAIKAQNRCTAALPVGSLYPTAACIGDCKYDKSSRNIQTCDKGLGICLNTSNGGLCLPGCVFDETRYGDEKGDGKCVGKNGCQVAGYGTSDSGKVVGVGFCFGGCLQDADCSSGEKCQVENGLCYKQANIKTYPKKLGEQCKENTDPDATGDCNCNAASDGVTKGTGFCTLACKTGEATPAGWVCSTRLPGVTETNPDAKTKFKSEPKGLFGELYKSCTKDDECKELLSKCLPYAGPESGKPISICVPAKQ